MDTSSWESFDDIERDLFEYSNLDYPGDFFAPAPPKSIAEYRARTSQVKNPGLFDDYGEDIGVFISGRGKYVKDRIISPGRPVDPLPEDDFIIQRKIREVSGLGYGNEIIEKAFGSNNSDVEETFHGAEGTHPDLQLFCSSQLASSSQSCSSSTQPLLKPTGKQGALLDIENSQIQESSKEEKDMGEKKKSSKKKKFTKWSPLPLPNANAINIKADWGVGLKQNVEGPKRTNHFPPLK